MPHRFSTTILNNPVILELPSINNTAKSSERENDSVTPEYPVFEVDVDGRESYYAPSEKRASRIKTHNRLCGVPYHTIAYAVIIVIPFIALAIGLIFYFILYNKDLNDFMSSIYTDCSNRATVIERQISGTLTSINGVAIWFDMTTPDWRSKEQFLSAVDLAMNNTINPWEVRTISFAPAINGSDRTQWEQQNNLNITTLLPDNQFTIAPERPYYFPTIWEYPDISIYGGFDINSEPVRSAALKKALSKREVTITPLLRLAGTNETGFCAYYPTYLNYSQSHTSFEGAVSGCFNAMSSISIALSSVQDSLDSCEIRDENGAVAYRTENVSQEGMKIHQMDFNILNETWTIICGKYYVPSTTPATTIAVVLVIGILFSLGLFACTQYYRLASREANLQRYNYNHSKHRAQAVLHAVPDPLVILNGEGRVVDCNKQALDIFSFAEKKRLIGTHLKQMFIDSEQNPIFDENIVKPGLHEVLVKRKDSENGFIAEANFSYMEDINSDDEARPFMTQVVLMRDITSKKEAAQQLHQAKLDAEDANQKKSQFLAFVCHELRNPLHVVSGMSDLLSEMVFEEDQVDYIKNIQTSCDHMQSIVNDVLDIAQLSQHELRLSFKPFHLRDLIEEEGRHATRMLCEKSDSEVVPIIKVDDNVPEYVNSDGYRLRQIIENVLDNSVKFTKQGIISLEVSATTDGSECPSMADIQFKFVDTGTGISEQQMREVFMPFSRANISIGNHFGSSGLGLSISHHLVDLLGGNITIDSRVNEGTTVIINLPLAISNEVEYNLYENEAILPRISIVHSNPSVSSKAWSITSNQSISSGLARTDDQRSVASAQELNPGTEPLALLDVGTPRSLSTEAPLTPPSSLESNRPASVRRSYFNNDDVPELDIIEEKPVCLVAEDNELCQKIASKLLGRDYVVEIAENGRIAVDTVMASPDRFSIIIMDIIMPEMNGIQATIELRNRGITCPIIAVTANAAEADKNEAMEHGFTDYITKPYKKNLLVHMQAALEAAQQSATE